MLEPTRPLVQAMERISERYGATAGQVALNWVINAHGSAVVTIPGASKASQAAQSAAAMKFTITPDEVAELNRLSAQFV
jgi:aryl-alcohol dehydrogenase-like predicted oxidoreductase